jgi:hypothetical protein
MTRCPHRLLRLLPLLLVAAAPPAARAQQAGSPPPQMDSARCDYFSRLHRFAEESKSMCDEGRQVKVGPLTGQILAQCHAAQKDRFDRLPIDDMIASFEKQVSAQGLGDACHAIKAQVWDLIQQ